MKLLKHIREARHPGSLYDKWHATLLAKQQGDRKWTVLHAEKHFHVDSPHHRKCTTLVYSSFGMGFREYRDALREDWQQDLSDHLPVEIYGAGAVAKLDGAAYVWTTAEMYPSAIMPERFWR